MCPPPAALAGSSYCSGMHLFCPGSGFYGCTSVVVSSGASFRPGQPRHTWPTPQRPPQRLLPSRSAPEGPGLQSPGLFFWTCSASSQPDPEDPRGFAPARIILPPVVMFLPVPLRRAQFKAFSFCTLPQFSFSLIHLLFPFPSSVLLHPFPSFPTPLLSLLATPRVQGRWTSSTARTPADSDQLPGHFPTSLLPTSLSVYLAPSFQVKARSSQRCRQQRPSHFQVYLGFI